MRLLIALTAFLFLFAACQQAETSSADATASTTNQGLKVGYVNTDSILMNYGYLKEQTAVLGKREQEASASLERKARKLQSQIQSFQQRAQSGNMTPKAIEGEQRVLAQREQELGQEQQRLAAEFQGEGMRLQAEVSNMLKKHVQAIQTEQNFDYIMSYGSGSNLLAVNEDFDITTKVLDLMNGDSPVDTTSVE